MTAFQGASPASVTCRNVLRFRTTPTQQNPTKPDKTLRYRKANSLDSSRQNTLTHKAKQWASVCLNMRHNIFNKNQDFLHFCYKSFLSLCVIIFCWFWSPTLSKWQTVSQIPVGFWCEILAFACYNVKGYGFILQIETNNVHIGMKVEEMWDFGAIFGLFSALFWHTDDTDWTDWHRWKWFTQFGQDNWLTLVDRLTLMDRFTQETRRLGARISNGFLLQRSQRINNI